MTNKKKIVAAQLSSVHSPADVLEPENVRRYVSRITDQVPLDIIILGWEERTALFEDLTSTKGRLSKEVFLWYPFLSDYPGMVPSHLVINYEAGRSAGWGGYSGKNINETFKQACPNNTEAVSTSMKHLERLLTTYDFDGVMIDKIRFPSMANGLKDVFSCFCPFCMEKAARAGLDLNDVKIILEKKYFADVSRKENKTRSGVRYESEWLYELLNDQPLLIKFIRFRIDSISEIVKKISEKIRPMDKKLSLDVFSPSLTTLVGQDLPTLGSYVDWVKPMIYRFGDGPSSLRSEFPAIVRELAAYLGFEVEQIIVWAGSHIDGLRGASLDQIGKVAPLELLLAESNKAMHLLKNTQVYLGLETVNIQGKMEITPQNVDEILENGSQAGVDGYVLSWDLMHTPLENVLPLKSLL